jgi:putative membrane protein
MKRWPYRVWLLVIVVMALVVGCIGPVSVGDTALQHLFTVGAMGVLVWKGARKPLSNLSYTLIAVFLLLHILGAHYLYSNVPYDGWAQALTGRTINSLFGWERNNYDRLVHLSFGLLMAPVVFEMGVRFAGIKGPHAGFWAALLAIGTVSMFGNIYEVVEWLIAVTMSKENAEQYNGQQGDVFDPQKDLAMSFAGSVLAAGICVWFSRGKKK